MQYNADGVHPKAKSAGAVQWAHSRKSSSMGTFMPFRGRPPAIPNLAVCPES